MIYTAATTEETITAALGNGIHKEECSPHTAYPPPTVAWTQKASVDNYREQKDEKTPVVSKSFWNISSSNYQDHQALPGGQTRGLP